MFDKILRKLYTFTFYLALPIIIIRLLWRSRKTVEYRQRIAERFGYFKPPAKTGGLWLHAVSLGEVNASQELIRSFEQLYPSEPITITTMTITGSQHVKTLFGERVFHVYIPYDIPVFLNKLIKKIMPKMVIIMETELWPNLLHTIHNHRIPLLLANARLSQKSAKRYAKIQPITRSMLQCFTKIAVQTEEEKERYIQLGAPVATLEVTGSIKFDMPVPAGIVGKTALIHNHFNKQLLWVAGSTHEGEEEILLDAYQALYEKFPNLLLFLVPRHPERFERVYQLCNGRHFKTCRRTELEQVNEKTQVVIGNTTGELMTFYNSADVVFVGGSLIPRGGHNLLEPAILAKPIMTGMHMFNFTEITRLLLQANALLQVSNVTEIIAGITHLLEDKAFTQQLCENALNVVNKNRGALAKHMELIDQLMISM